MEEAPRHCLGFDALGDRWPPPCSVVVALVACGSVQTCASSAIVPTATRDRIRNSSGPIHAGYMENLLFIVRWRGLAKPGTGLEVYSTHSRGSCPRVNTQSTLNSHYFTRQFNHHAVYVQQHSQRAQPNTLILYRLVSDAGTVFKAPYATTTKRGTSRRTVVMVELFRIHCTKTLRYFQRAQLAVKTFQLH